MRQFHLFFLLLLPLSYSQPRAPARARFPLKFSETATTTESDLEGDFGTNALPQCLDTSFYVKYGWSQFSNFTNAKREIILEVDWWDSGILIANVFFQIVRGVMGYKVDYRLYDGAAATGPRLASGNSADIALELWQSDASGWYEQFVQLQNSVISFGSIGYTGRVGLYFPSYMLDQYPQYDTLDFWKSLTHPATQKLFPRSGSSPIFKGADGLPICDGDPLTCVNGTYYPAWYNDADKEYFTEIWHETPGYTPYYFQRLIDGLKINATINFMGGNMYPMMVAAYQAKKPFLVYNWRPTTTIAGFNLTRVIFPDDSYGGIQDFRADPINTPVKVDIPVETLFKASSARFVKDFPELGYFMTKFVLTDSDIEYMLASIGPNLQAWNDTGYLNVSCSWVKSNEDVWQYWIPIPPTNHFTCPIGTGRYILNSLYVCLECPPGTFNLNSTTIYECQVCLPHTICSGGSSVHIDSMFWIPEIPDPKNITGDYLPEVHFCPHPKQCCPYGDCASNDICSPGFTGIFCTECSNPQQYAWNGQCMQCSTSGSSLYLAIFLPIIATAAVIFVPKYHASEIEQLAFYFQVINLIFDNDVGSVVGWEGLNKILAVFSLDLDGLVLNCPVPLHGIPKLLFRFMLPLLILFYFGCYYILLKTFPFIHQSLPTYMVQQNVGVLFARSFTIVFSFVFMPLVEASLNLLNCDTVQGVSRLYQVPTVICYTPAHNGPAAFAFIVLGLLLFVYPLWLLLLLLWLWHKDRISVIDDYHFKDRPMDQIYEAFYMPYRPKFFYMESVVIWERGLIVLTFTFLNHYTDSLAAIAYLAIFSLSGFARAYIQPYKKLLQVYLNREIGIAFLVLLILRQYAKFEPEPLSVTPYVGTMIILPVINHAVRWIRQGYVERSQVLERLSEQGINPGSEMSHVPRLQSHNVSVATAKQYY